MVQPGNGQSPHQWNMTIQPSRRGSGGMDTAAGANHPRFSHPGGQPGPASAGRSVPPASAGGKQALLIPFVHTLLSAGFQPALEFGD